jgi:hypothetical protein
LKEELVKAYREADYKILALELTVKISNENRKLSHLMKQRNWSSYVMITAWNPYSVKDELGINRKRNNQLLKDLLNKEVYIFPSLGKDPNQKWESEESWLAFNLSKAEGLILGKKYSQNAIVFGLVNQKAKLVFCE